MIVLFIVKSVKSRSLTMPPTATTVAAHGAAGVPWHGGQDLRVYVQVTLHAPQVGLKA